MQAIGNRNLAVLLWRKQVSTWRDMIAKMETLAVTETSDDLQLAISSAREGLAEALAAGPDLEFFA